MIPILVEFEILDKEKQVQEKRIINICFIESMFESIKGTTGIYLVSNSKEETFYHVVGSLEETDRKIKDAIYKQFFKPFDHVLGH